MASSKAVPPALNPQNDHCEIIRLAIEDGLVWDMVRALEIALFRTFAAPSISKLLDRTGEFEKNGQKRYDDTALLLLNILRHGYDSDEGQRAIARMNGTHAHYRISNDDFLFTLSTFVIDPIRWTEQFGWRRFTEDEKESLFLTMIAVGQRMKIQALPNSRAAMTAWSDQYVAQQFQHSDANQRVADATIRIVEHWLPRIFRPLVRPVTAGLLDSATREAVGLQLPSPWLNAVIRFLLRSRAVLKRLGPLTLPPQWPTGQRSYPKGYEIEQLAPEKLLRMEQQASRQK